MPRKSLEIPVVPEVLVWARESVGLSPIDVSKKLNVSEDLVYRWESGDEHPTLKKLEKLASIYKRSLAVFFLPSPPIEPPLPKDFRSFPKEKENPLSPKILLSIRNARRLQSLAMELAKEVNREIVSKVRRVNISDDPESIAKRIRHELDIEIETQIKWRDENQALNEWKKAVEKQGILVFQMSMPLEEIRAFSLTDKEPFAIVLNSKDSTNAGIFSLFHEYAHILLGYGGLCNNMEEPTEHHDGGEKAEIFCNHFAGALLVPAEPLLKRTQHIREQFRWVNGSFYPIDEILRKNARYFKVSQEVVLRRMVICDLVEKGVYERKREEWKTKEWKQKKTGFPVDPAKKCIREKGESFVTLTLEAYRQERITYKDVADYLSTRTKHIPKIEQLV